MTDPPRKAWWRSIGPGLITACVVFGPGSLLVSSNVGARYGYDLLWLLVLTGIFMGTYVTLAARIGVVGGASPCTLVAARLGRPAAFILGLNLCLICATFQFGNNLAFVLAAKALVPGIRESLPAQTCVLVAINALIIVFLFSAREIYRVVERIMKVMVALILACFLFNLGVAIARLDPSLSEMLRGLLPGLPEDLTVALPSREDGEIVNPMVLVAGLVGTTFSVGGAFFQGNLVRERGWTIRDYRNGFGDAIAGVSVLACVSLVIILTTATVIRGREASDIGVLAESLAPLLGPTAYTVFCIGLLAVASNPFLINAMIGGTILADGAGLPARLSDPWPRFLTVLVLLLGMGVAIAALHTGERPVDLVIFGQALTVLGNPLMAVTLLWLANRRDVLGEYRNRLVHNVFGALGLGAVVVLAVYVLKLLMMKLGL